MHTISFIYRIDKTNQTYFGKYLTENISDNHDGLDTIIRPKLTYGLNKHRRLNNKNKLKQSIFIGVLSYSNAWIDFSSEREIKCFDFLYEQYKTKEGVEVEDYWVNGQLLSDVEKNNNSRLPVAGETAKTNYTNEDNPKETFVELLTSI
jgi:hypothetical protein